MRRWSHSRRAHTQAGFNLIEVVSALAVVSIGLVSILGLLPHALQASRDAQDRTIAATVAAQYFAECRADGFDNIQASYPTMYLGADGYATSATSPQYFIVNVSSANKTGMVDSSGKLTVKVITAVISWRYPNPVSSDTFVTEVAKYTP